MQTTVFLDEVSAQDTDVVGGKGANLGELINHGFPVPPGFVVTAACYRQFIDQFDAPGDISALAAFREQLLTSAPPAGLGDALTAADITLRSTDDKPFVYAVRSSATAEDLIDASFAGQHATYYYVTIDNLLLMVMKCWASLWSDEAWSYRVSKGIDHPDVNMAVVVQRMVQSDSSGVTFTADPVSGSDKVIVTESCWGMGAALVDGRVSPDQYITDKASGRLTSIRISDKKFMVPATIEENAASRLVPVPAEKRNAESLTDEMALIVSEWAARSAEHFGGNQDLEWAFEGGVFYLLQSRPITVTGFQESETPAGKFILFKPMAENFTGPFLPLSRDLLARAFPMVEIIYGRVYVRFGIIRPILPFKLTDEEVAQLAYLSGVESPRLSWWRLVPLAILGVLGYLVSGVLYHRVDNMPKDFMASFRQRVREVVDDPSIDAADTIPKLFFGTRFFEPIGNMVLMNNLAAPRYIALIAATSRLLARWLPELREDAASFLCAGDPDILSTDMGRRILGLAHTARENESVRQIITSETGARALERLADLPEAGPFRAGFDEFLSIHGHRSLREFEINSARWEEDPTPVLAMIRNYLLADTDLETTESAADAERENLWQTIEQGLMPRPLERAFQPRLRLLRHLASRAKYLIRLRENSRFHHIMAFYAARKKVLETESLLLSQGRLKCKDDIFFLLWPEVKDLVAGRSDWTDVEDLIRERRMEYIRLGKQTAPRTIGIDIKPVAVDPDHKRLSGQAAAPGTYEGIARVIMDPAVSAELHPGEILIAPYTDPAWTPLFLTAHAAVVEVGSYLSHAGTIAREYGMPCVVDVADCTRKIKSGDRIRVDGSTGSVILLEPGEHEEASND